MAKKKLGILVLVEKHDTVYMDASTPKRLDASCRIVLAERLAQHYYDAGDAPTMEYVQRVYAFAGDAASIAKAQQVKLDSLLKEWTSDRDFEEQVKACLESAQKWTKGTNYDAKPWLITAYSLLASRDGAEYEGVRLEQVINPFDA